MTDVGHGLNEDDLDLLLNLDGEWRRPMDLGGHDGSYHSRALAKLARKGMAERARRDTICNMVNSRRGSYLYRIAPLGLAVRDYLKEQGG